MGKVTKEAALLYHSQGKPGKIEVLVGKKKSQLKVVKSISKKSGAKINMKKGTYRYFKLRAKYGDITVESKPVKIKA